MKKSLLQKQNANNKKKYFYSVIVFKLLPTIFKGLTSENFQIKMEFSTGNVLGAVVF